QVIVMSSHETIRVLEVGVDTPLPAEEERKPPEMPPGEGARGSPGETSPPGTEDIPPSTQSSCSGETAGETPSFPGTHSLSLLPPSLEAKLGPGSLGWSWEDELIAGQVAGQQGLAVWTFPTATVAALPGLTAPSPTGGIFKPPIANLQGNRLLCGSSASFIHPCPGPQPLAPSIRAESRPFSAGRPPILPQPPAAPTPPVAKPLETQTQIALQPAGFAFNPGIISAASLGAQTQLLGSLAATPVIASTISGVQGVTGQILTNAQGQVIGTLPWVVNPPGMAATSPVPATLPAQNLQVQTVTPQLLFNAQGQVIATLAGSAIPAATIKKATTPEPPTKNEVQPIQPAPALSQPTVVVANPAPAAKVSPVPVPITCSETPTVSQLVSKPPAPNSSAEEEGINLEEIREFAKNFKIRRLSLGLTQTQVGQALTATEGPAYSQSAICRY
ncbi:PO6F1 factor, partial [Rostratula benghalensis]|nr:PO6F1 factor [Rostratula benghalensis]